MVSLKNTISFLRNEEYCFIPKDSSLKQYRFKREHDEWHSADEDSEAVIDSAVDTWRSICCGSIEAGFRPY
jgi:hypothetical protein